MEIHVFTKSLIFLKDLFYKIIIIFNQYNNNISYKEYSLLFRMTLNPLLES